MLIIEKKCKTKEDWGYLMNNTWSFKPKFKSRLNIYLCLYRPILRYKDDSKYETGAWFTLDHGSYILNEVIEVECRRKTSKNIAYNSLFIQFISKYNSSKLKHNSENRIKKLKPLDIILLSYDSVYSCVFFFLTGLHFFHLLLGLLLFGLQNLIYSVYWKIINITNL